MTNKPNSSTYIPDPACCPDLSVSQVIFSELYRVRSLPFDDYVTSVFEKYIHSLIEIEPLVRFPPTPLPQ